MSESDYYESEDYMPMEEVGWEYLRPGYEEHEVWLKDYDTSCHLHRLNERFITLEPVKFVIAIIICNKIMNWII